MKPLLSLLFLLGCTVLKAQEAPVKWNFDVEQNTTASDLPEGWVQMGQYRSAKDREVFYSGKQSVSVDSEDGKGNFGAVAFTIPAQFKGKTITLEAYMKIENASMGSAGLLLRLDGDGESLQFSNMSREKIQGTKDWTKYAVSLPYDGKTDEIIIGGILIGKGKAWFDAFSLKIDGVAIQKMKKTEAKSTKVALDKAFDAGSGFSLKTPTTTQAENLFLLGKVWGFVKYHHPEVAKGNHNWDYELFRILPKLDAPDFKGELLAWIEKLGPFKSDSSAGLPTKDVKLQPDTQWISDTTLCSEKLSKLLLQLNNAHNSSNYYVAFYPQVKNPKFDNEVGYSQMKWDDSGYRLLALFRYWNIIEYYFPNRHLMDENWDAVLREYTPRIIEGNDELSYKLTLLEVIGKIQDTHASILSYEPELEKFFGEKIVPLEISYIENQFVVTKVHQEFKGSLKVGDVILTRNGETVADYAGKNKKYFPASNQPTQFRNICRNILRSNDPQISVTYQSGNEIHTAELETIKYQYWPDGTTSNKTIGGDIGYIYPASLKHGEIKDIMKNFGDKKGIVVDFRCYPSDFIVFSLGRMLLPKKTTFVKFSKGSHKYPGLFQYTDETSVGFSNADYYKGKVAILINEQTQSSAEYHAMALRLAPKAAVIGSTTAGADGNVSKIKLPGKVTTMISGIGVYYPDGTETQRIGIVPDIEAKPTIKGVSQGKDEVLDRAVEWINQ